VLFVGTSQGVFVTLDGGSQWTSLRGNMPGTPIRTMVLQPIENDLIVGTWGRGIWVLDDVTQIEQWRTRDSTSSAYLFPIRPTVVYAERPPRFPRYSPSGTNPAYGIQFAYYLKHAVSKEAQARLDIVDGKGSVVRRLPIDTAAGLHRALWDFQVAEPGDSSESTWRPTSLKDWSASGVVVRAPPGRYRARLTMLAASSGRAAAARARWLVAQREFTLLADPLMRESKDSYDSLYALQRRVARLAALIDATTRAADSAQARLKGKSRPDAISAELDRVLLALRGPQKATDWAWARMPIGVMLMELLGGTAAKLAPEEMPTAARVAQLPELERFVRDLARDVRRLSAAADHVAPNAQEK
jgi:hypothetical protein